METVLTQGLLEFALERGLYLYSLSPIEEAVEDDDYYYYSQPKERFTPAQKMIICNVIQFVLTYKFFPGNFRKGNGSISG